MADTKPDVIESASGTTDHENNRAGKGPVVAVVVILAVLCLVTASLGSCVGRTAGYIADIAVDNYENGNSYGYGGSGSDSYDWLDELLGGNGLTNDWSFNIDSYSGEMDASTTIDCYLDYYDGTISEGISATDYAGASDAVRSYVTKLVKIDSDTNTEVVKYLRSAYNDIERGDTVAAEDEIEAAIAHCRSAISDLEALGTLSGDDQVSQAANDVALDDMARWKATMEQLGTIDLDGTVNYDDFAGALDEVAEDLVESTNTLAAALGN